MFNSGSNLDPGAGMVTSRSGLIKGNPLLTEKFTTDDKTSLLAAFHKAAHYGADNVYPYESPSSAIDTVGDIVPGDVVFACSPESSLLDTDASTLTPTMRIMSLRAWNTHFDKIVVDEYKSKQQRLWFAAGLHFAGVAKALYPGNQMVQTTIGRVHDGVFNIWSGVKHQSRLWVVLGEDKTKSDKLQLRPVVKSSNEYPDAKDFGVDFTPLRKYRIGVVTSCDSAARLASFNTLTEFPFHTTGNYSTDLRRLGQLHRLTVYVNGRLFQ